MTGHVVDFTQVEKSYGDVRALNQLSFAIRPGEIVGLLGPNGAGKTTAIHILLGLITPDAGKVSIFGLSPYRNRAQVLQRLNFASAYTSLPSNLTVTENLRIFARLYDVREMHRKIDELLMLFELEQFRRTAVGHLSSGEQMRVSLAKSLLNDPELLLLDEPTLSLDPYRADAARKFLQRLQRERGMTMLYTSHNMQEVETLCHRVIFIHHGRLIAEGSPAEVKRRFNTSTLDDVFIRIAQGGELVATDEETHAS